VTRLAAATIALLLVRATAAASPEPVLPQPQGFVTDRAGVIDPEHAARITTLAQALARRTGAEIAVLTVESTAPLDDFSYALRVAEAWGIGRRGADTGVLVLLAVRDRRVRILVGYGLEGVLPDGLVGEIQDREMVPAFRAGRIGEGLWRGVAALAQRIAADRGVTLDGEAVPPASPGGAPTVSLWVLLLLVIVMVVVVVALASDRGQGIQTRGRYRPASLPRGIWPAGGGFGGGGGGFGGFGGFGGGRFGGGGAGRGW